MKDIKSFVIKHKKAIVIGAVALIGIGIAYWYFSRKNQSGSSGLSGSTTAQGGGITPTATTTQTPTATTTFSNPTTQNPAVNPSAASTFGAFSVPTTQGGLYSGFNTGSITNAPSSYTYTKYQPITTNTNYTNTYTTNTNYNTSTTNQTTLNSTIQKTNETNQSYSPTYNNQLSIKGGSGIVGGSGTGTQLGNIGSFFNSLNPAATPFKSIFGSSSSTQNKKTYYNPPINSTLSKINKNIFGINIP